MLVLENISIVMMLVSEGGESSQMTLMRYFFNFHKRIIVYRSLWLSSQDTAIRKFWGNKIFLPMFLLS